MRAVDLTPLFRSAIGFERMMDLLDRATRVEGSDMNYPPYNIEKTGEDAYRITMAVAGFGEEDLTIETQQNTLLVIGDRKDQAEEHTYLHQGIAGRSFRRTFQLADYVKVVGAHLENGLLHIELVREVPEEMRPRRIQITTGAATRKVASRKPKLVQDSEKQEAA